MSILQYKNPISPIQVLNPFSVARNELFGTNFSVLGVGGFMEVYNLDDLQYTIPSGRTGTIEFSGNTIPIQFKKGSGSVFSPDVLTLNSDNISSGRRRLGMLVYVYETDKIYQFTIRNYDSLWSAATGATGDGGKSVVINTFGTVVKNNSVAGQNFINSWTGSTIEGVSGFTNANAAWRILNFSGGGGSSTADTFVTGFTLSSNTITLTQNRTDQYSAFTISLSAYTGTSTTISGNYLPLSGGTVTGNTIFQSGLTANTISATTYFNLPVTADTFVTGFTLSSNTITLTQNRTDQYSAFTISLSAYTGSSSTTSVEYLPLSGGTVTGNTIFNSGLTANTLTVTGNTILSGLTATTISATTYQNLPVTADTFVTGFTLSSNTLTISQNRLDQYSAFTISLSAYTGTSISGLYLPLSGGTVTGNTIFQSGLTANTISATTYQNLPSQSGTGISAFSYSPTTGVLTITKNDTNTLTAGTFSYVSATTLSSSNVLSVSSNGGTPTTTTINAVTGGTYSNGTITLSGTGNFASSISGFPTTFTNDYLPLSGGTVTGNTIFNSGLTATTISATTYQNLPIDPDTYVTGFTLSSNTITLTQNRTDGYSSFTISLSAYTGSSSTTSGEYLPLSGGTVTGGTIFQSGVTANTISEVNYVNFKTSPSVPNPTGGTLYYDSNENALSYKPITQSNDVTVNLGQESLIRIYNNLGYQINNGQVLHITGGTNGVPTVALSNASKLGTVFTESLAQSSGVATHNIPNEEYGFMTNFGVVRDLNTTAFTVGQEVFLSDTVDGALTNSPNNIAFTSRVSTVGYCLESNATTGKILVSITNENLLQSLTQQEVNVLLGNTISTGVYEYTGITQGTGQTVNVGYVRGWIVYNTNTYSTNPLVLNVYYSGGTNIPLTYLNSADATYFLINSGATLLQQATFPTPQQRRENIFLGKVVHPNRTTILAFNNTVDFDVSPMAAIRDIWTPIKLINQGVIPSFNTGLTINTSYGTFWGNGIGWTTNQLNPDSVTITAKTRASFFYRTQTGGTSSAVFDIDPTKYDVGGVITSVGAPGSNDATNQRIYMYPTGVINILYGQTRYTTLAAAVAAIDSESFVIYPNADTTGILIGIISVRNDIVADGEPLTNTTYAKLTLTSKFGESFGGTGGISTTTLQQAYNNSTSPEIVISAALDGLTIQNGTGNADNVTNLLEGRATSSGTTSFIRADGLISGSSVSANAISGTTWYGLPSSSFSGGTVNGATDFTNGLSANTISATTYENLTTASTSTTGVLTSTDWNTFNGKANVSQTNNDEVRGLQGLGSVIKAAPIGLSLNRINTTLTLTTGRLQLTAVYVAVESTITGVKFYQSTQGNYTAANTNSVALYSYDSSTGNANLVAVTANDGNLWKGASGTWTSAAFTATTTIQSGTYYIGMLYNASGSPAQTPIIGAATGFVNAIVPFDFPNSGKLTCHIVTQNTIPSTWTHSASTVNNPVNAWINLY